MNWNQLRVYINSLSCARNIFLSSRSQTHPPFFFQKHTCLLTLCPLWPEILSLTLQLYGKSLLLSLPMIRAITLVLEYKSNRTLAGTTQFENKKIRQWKIPHPQKLKKSFSLGLNKCYWLFLLISFFLFNAQHPGWLVSLTQLRKQQWIWLQSWWARLINYIRDEQKKWADLWVMTTQLCQYPYEQLSKDFRGYGCCRPNIYHGRLHSLYHHFTLTHHWRKMHD